MRSWHPLLHQPHRSGASLMSPIFSAIITIGSAALLLTGAGYLAGVL